MQKKGAALRAVQCENVTPDGDAAKAPDPSTGSGRAEGPEHKGEGESLPARLQFTPVPRRYRHDGWTPERQRAFIAALADTGCVDRSARMVNIAQTNCYELRRAPGAEEFRRAWDAALDFGLLRLKDVAFERAIEGELVPVFSAGKLMGYRRKRNDALLMFCLRHYGQDASGKRVTVNYFSTRASAGVVGAGAAGRPSTALGTNEVGAGVEASTTTVRTVISGPSTGSGRAEAERNDAAAALLNGFEGVTLDAEAQAAIARALEDCAARARAAEAAAEAGGTAAADAAADDPGEIFFRSDDYHGALLPPCLIEDFEPFVEGEPHWHLAGAEKPAALIAFEEERAAAAGGGETGERGSAPPV